MVAAQDPCKKFTIMTFVFMLELGHHYRLSTEDYLLLSLVSQRQEISRFRNSLTIILTIMDGDNGHKEGTDPVSRCRKDGPGA